AAGHLDVVKKAPVPTPNVGIDPRLTEAQSAFAQAMQLKDGGKHADAIPPGEHALELREAVLGSTHPEVASCLNLLGDLYWRKGDPTRGGTLLKRALD